MQVHCVLLAGLLLVLFAEQGESACKNIRRDYNCRRWKRKGYCTRKWEGWMKKNCADTCGHCDKLTGSGDCKDDNAGCADWAKSGECDKNPIWMKENCKKSCNTCPEECKDDNEGCAEWAKNGECKKNPKYMLESCKKSCGN